MLILGFDREIAEGMGEGKLLTETSYSYSSALPLPQPLSRKRARGGEQIFPVEGVKVLMDNPG